MVAKITDWDQIEEQDWYWLVGLLEGEGTFLKGPPSDLASPIIAVQMTDRDIIERIAAFWGTKITKHMPRNSRHKVTYIARIRGSRAVTLMQKLRPFLGKRRQQQIDVAIDNYIFPPNSHHARLTPGEIREIVEKARSGEHQKDIAATFGVKPSVVYDIIHGYSFTNITNIEKRTECKQKLV